MKKAITLGLIVCSLFMGITFDLHSPVYADSDDDLLTMIVPVLTSGGRRNYGRNQVIINGCISGAAIKAYLAGNDSEALFETTSDENGAFSLTLPKLDDETCILIAATGGEDPDGDGDGRPDAAPTPVNGELHALLTVGQLSKGVLITPLTEIAYRFSHNLVGQVDCGEVADYADQLAQVLIKSDLNGDGQIDYPDLACFSPPNSSQRDKLNFDYTKLYEEDGDGHSVTGCLYDNLPDKLLELLDMYFGNILTLYPGMSPDYDRARLTLAPFGRGRVTSGSGGLVYDSANTADQNKLIAFFDPDKTQKVVLTASPYTDTEILEWNGCDEISDDKTRCTSFLGGERLVSVSFGYKETRLRDNVNVVDFSSVKAAISEDGVDITFDINSDNADLIEKINGLTSGDYIVGDASGGFLRRVLGYVKVDDEHYKVTTEDASLEDIIGQGSGVRTLNLTEGNLQPEESPQPAFVGVEGVRLVRTGDPDNRKIRLAIGREERASVGGEVTLIVGGVPVHLKGTIDVTVDVDTGISYSWLGMDYFKFIPKVTLSQNLEASVGNAFKGEADTDLFSLYFTPFILMIGPVPVYIQPTLDFKLGVEANIEGKLAASVTLKRETYGGIIWNSNTGLKTVSGDEVKFPEFSRPTTSLTAELKPYVGTSVDVEFYGITGPQLSAKGYLLVKAAMQNVAMAAGECENGAEINIFGGIGCDFEWDLDKFEKISKSIHDLIHDKALKIEIAKWEKPLAYYYHYLGEDCDDPAYLEIYGSDIKEQVRMGGRAKIIREYTVKNTGDLPLDWSLDWFPDAAISVVIENGGQKLYKGQETKVTVTIDTASMTVGKYKNKVSFANKTPAAALRPGGSDYRLVDIDVLPAELGEVEFIGQEYLSCPGAMLVKWRYNGNPAHITGFKMTLNMGYHAHSNIETLPLGEDVTWDPYVSWTKYYGPTEFCAIIDFTPDWSSPLTLKAYNGFSESKPDEIRIGRYGVEPKRGCGAWFSQGTPRGYEKAGPCGSMLFDIVKLGTSYATYWHGQRYCPQIWEKRWYGLGSINNTAYGIKPELIKTIVVDKNTRLTIYDKNGDIALQREGPAILVEDFITGTSCSDEYTDPWPGELGTTFPISVREGIDTKIIWDEDSWQSLRIECHD